MKQLIYLLLLVGSLAFTTVTQPEKAIPMLNVSTKCNVVDLSSSNFTGIARSGYLSVGKNSSVLTFIFYGRNGVTNPNDLNNYPTIVWLNGGPGESSQWGNFNGLGALSVRRKIFGTGLEAVLNNNSWTREYNLLFVDQPVGTGLSYADPAAKNVFPASTSDVAKDFYEALSQLYNNQNGCFSAGNLNIRTSSPIYIFGQEYAGKFAPAIASLMLERGGFPGLKGVAIADGLTSPYDMLAEMGNYAYHMSLIDYQQRTIVQQMLINATVCLESRDFEQAHNTFKRVLDYITGRAGNINIFNYNKFGNDEDLINEFFHLPDTAAKFNLNPEIRFGMQADQVYLSLYNDYMRPQTGSVGNLLRNGVAVLVYTGQDNLIAHAPGTMRWVDSISFPDDQAFRNAVLTTWRVKNQIVGTVKSAGKLQLRILFGAGRNSASEAPESTFEMVKQWIGRTR